MARANQELNFTDFPLKKNIQMTKWLVRPGLDLNTLKIIVHSYIVGENLLLSAVKRIFPSFSESTLNEFNS